MILDYVADKRCMATVFGEAVSLSVEITIKTPLFSPFTQVLNIWKGLLAPSSILVSQNMENRLAEDTKCKW